MGIKLHYFAIGFSVLFLILIFESIRRKKLKEQYSLLWIAAAVVMIVFSVWQGILEKFSQLLGVYYAPSTLFLLTLLFTLLLVLHFSIIVTKLSNQNIKLAQELALLANKLETIKEERQ